MGCVASKLDINDVHPNMFAVNNVDDVRNIFSFFLFKLFACSFFVRTFVILAIADGGEVELRAARNHRSGAGSSPERETTR